MEFFELSGVPLGLISMAFLLVFIVRWLWAGRYRDAALAILVFMAFSNSLSLGFLDRDLERHADGVCQSGGE